MSRFVDNKKTLRQTQTETGTEQDENKRRAPPTKVATRLNCNAAAAFQAARAATGGNGRQRAAAGKWAELGPGTAGCDWPLPWKPALPTAVRPAQLSFRSVGGAGVSGRLIHHGRN